MPQWKKFKHIDRNSAAFCESQNVPSMFAIRTPPAADSELFINFAAALYDFHKRRESASTSANVKITERALRHRRRLYNIDSLMCENVIEMEVLETLLMYACGSRNPIAEVCISRLTQGRQRRAATTRTECPSWGRFRKASRFRSGIDWTA